MAGDDTTHFQFEYGGIMVEVSGEREFVDDMYRQVMKDIQQARRQPVKSEVTSPLPPEQVVWVHRCSEMMHKIYMATPSAVSRTILGRAINIGILRRMYVDKDVFERILPSVAGDHTLFAELTDLGRAEIGNRASESSRKKTQQGPPPVPGSK